jgi:hypothetical protein
MLPKLIVGIEIVPIFKEIGALEEEHALMNRTLHVSAANDNENKQRKTSPILNIFKS